jgi:tripartite-type tricarboxylate transporter receptor subunit TctC
MGKKRSGTWTISLFLSFSMILFCWPSAWAAEEPYPSRPVSIIIPYTPGGTLDTHAKLLGDKLGEVLGQPFLNMHKPGGGGTLGTSYAARAKADGYTLLTGTTSALAFTPIIKKVDYSLEDFIPLGMYCKGAIHFFVRADSKYKTIQDFVTEGKKRAEPMKVSSFGKMTPADFVLEMFSKQAGIKLAHVPYKSSTEAGTALLGGHVEGAFVTSSMGQMESGTFRLLAIADHERSRVFPDGKTFKELGYPIALPIWYSLCVPQKTPKKIVDILANGMQEVYKRYGKEIAQALIQIEFSPDFLDSKQSILEYKKDYETILIMAKQLGIEAK